MYYNWKENTNTEELKIVCNLIKNGELVIFPTETVYGIGANALDENAVAKIFLAKGRPADNPLIVHIADRKTIEKIAKDITEVEQKLIDAFMPGPFTIILKKKDVLPSNVTGGLDTVAVRMPNNVIAKAIIQFSNCPIAAPSANISGRPSGTDIEEIRQELEGKVSAIIDGGKTDIGLESTVVKVVDETPIILRPGKITAEDIKSVVGKCIIDNTILSKVDENQKVESPGMKYKHYAPKTECLLVYCEDDLDQIFEINRIIKKYRGDVVLLGLKEHSEKIVMSKERYIELGSKEDLDSVARNFYSALRKADEFNAQIVIIEGVKKEGLGLAIMNRMLRTCGFNYIEK
ncbi:MAG: threonylcarbamoyl-AMP synthase [Clostridia bacterium]|nr:threonylcarbamoyl-AMP synthase [Clostridia bacterium]